MCVYVCTIVVHKQHGSVLIILTSRRHLRLTTAQTIGLQWKPANDGCWVSTADAWMWKTRARSMISPCRQPGFQRSLVRRPDTTSPWNSSPITSTAMILSMAVAINRINFICRTNGGRNKTNQRWKSFDSRPHRRRTQTVQSYSAGWASFWWRE